MGCGKKLKTDPTSGGDPFIKSTKVESQVETSETLISVSVTPYSSFTAFSLSMSAWAPLISSKFLYVLSVPVISSSSVTVSSEYST